jgi:hypothetical protein
MLVKASIAIIIGIGFDDALSPPSPHRRHRHSQQVCDLIYSQLASGSQSCIAGLELVFVSDSDTTVRLSIRCPWPDL